MERSTESREMASQTYSTLSEEQRETDKRRGLFDAAMQPVVMLHRIGMYCFIYCGLNVQFRHLADTLNPEKFTAVKIIHQ